MQPDASTSLFDQKLVVATKGLEPYFLNHLKTKLSQEYAIIICDYIASMRIETNLSDNHRRDVITSLKILSQFLVNKPFKEMTRNDLLLYLDTLRKPVSLDRRHKWVSTYNHRLIAFLRFFKWLYSPYIDPSNRQKPPVITNIPTIQRKEKSPYLPSDLWTEDDHILFLRYCVNKRDRCYHAVAVDTSCRPTEILTLRIKDVSFKMLNNLQYAEIVVNGKTGSRVVPLFNSIPFLKDWIDNHPQSGNPVAFLFCGLGNRVGRQLSRYAIYDIYDHYKKKYLPSLAESMSVPRADIEKISKLIKKPFNPYIQRHSALTQKMKILNEHAMRQHAGWGINSKMLQVYIHWFGNESSNTLLESYGVKKPTEELNKLKPKIYPNCNESNKINAKFCDKYRMILQYDTYIDKILNNNQNEDYKKLEQEIVSIRKELADIVAAKKMR